MKILALTLAALLALVLVARHGRAPSSSVDSPLQGQASAEDRSPVAKARPRLAEPRTDPDAPAAGAVAQTVTPASGVVATVVPGATRYQPGHAIDVGLELTDADGRPLEGWGGAQVFVIGAGDQAWHDGFVEDGLVPGRYVARVLPEGAGPGPLEVRVLLAGSGNLAEPDRWTEVTYSVERL
jgi:hypothetical protein